MTTPWLRPYANPRPPYYLPFRSSTRFIGFTSFVATFTDGFLYGAIVPVLPFSLHDISGIPQSQVQLWVSALLMTFGAAMVVGAPIACWTATYFESRRVPFLTGLFIAFASTLLFAFGRAPWVLVLARALQGLSAPLVNTTALALVADSVDENEIGSWIGFVLSGMNIGLLAAPALAGAIYERAGYHAVFGVILGVIAFDFLLRVTMVEKRTAAFWLESIDDCATSSFASDSCDEESISSSASHSRRYTREDWPDETSALLADRARAREKQSGLWSAVATMRVLLSSSRLNTALYGGFVHTMLIVSLDAVLPRFVMEAFSWKATASGMVFLAVTIPSLSSALVGKLSDRYGARAVSLLGFAVVAPALAAMGFCKDDNVASQVLLVVFLVFVGLGLNSILTPLAADVYHEAKALAWENPEKIGVMGAFAQVYSLFVGALGIASFAGPGLSGLLYGRTSWQITMSVLAGLCAIGSLAVWKFTGPRVEATKDHEDALEDTSRV